LPLALLVSVSACRGAPTERDRLAVRDSAGIRLVRLPADTNLTFAQWSVRQLYSSQAWDSIRLGPAADAVFTTGGALVVADGPDLYRIDSTGAGVRRVAREGDGPGEFRAIFRVGSAGGGSLFVWDYWSGRLTQLTPEGRVTRIIRRLGLDRNGRETEPVTLPADGRVLATLWQWRPNRGTLHGLSAGAFERDPVPLLALDEASGRSDTLGVWAGLERTVVSLEGEESRLPVPFARSVVLDGRDSLTVIGVSDSVDLWLYRGRTPMLRLTQPATTGPPAAGDRPAWEARLRTDRPDIAAVVLAALADAPRVPRLPRVGGVVLDDRGDLWVGDYLRPGVPRRRWLVFSAGGEPLGRLELPAHEEPLMPSRTELLDVAGDRVALLGETPDGERTISVWQLRR